jgi:hypothetical protein
MPSLANTASKTLVNLLSRSRTKNMNWAARSPRSISSCALAGPRQLPGRLNVQL